MYHLLIWFDYIDDNKEEEYLDHHCFMNDNKTRKKTDKYSHVLDSNDIKNNHNKKHEYDQEKSNRFDFYYSKRKNIYNEDNDNKIENQKIEYVHHSKDFNWNIFIYYDCLVNMLNIVNNINLVIDQTMDNSTNSKTFGVSRTYEFIRYFTGTINQIQFQKWCF